MIIDEKDEATRKIQLDDFIRNHTDINLSEDDIGHITYCLLSIYNWYERGYIPGSFIASLLKNDFLNTFFNADTINRRVLSVYAYFLYWEMPSDYLTKAKLSKLL